MKEEKKCMFPDCEIMKIYSRGVCSKHYNLMANAVRGNKKTWDDFVKHGYCLEAKRGIVTEVSKHFYEILEKM